MTGDRESQGGKATTLKDEEQKPQPPNWLIDNIAEASRNASKIYFLYLGSVAYCALTVFSTTDRQIILNEKARLPIVNLDVSLNGFFWLSPIIVLLIFTYFQLYLHRLKGLTADLRENYAQIEKRRLYPWLLNIAEDQEPGMIGALQVIAAKFTLWMSLPILLSLNAFFYTKKHEPVLSYIVGLISVAGTVIVLWFWWMYDRKQWRKTTTGLIINSVAVAFILAFQASLLFWLIPFAREGAPYKDEIIPSWEGIYYKRDFTYSMYRWLRSLVCVDLSYQKLIVEPEKDKDYSGLYWGNLKNAHLEGANLKNSILKRCDMRGVQLQRTDISDAVLQGANLSGANLEEAYLGRANLEGANLRVANLGSAILSEANLKGTILIKANLGEAYFEGADFSSADLMVAGLYKAQLQRANLHAANLEGANLEEADLWGANLEGAKLEGANLEGANLVGTKGLRIKEQLSRVKTLYKAKLDPKILIEIKRNYFRLLEKPKDRTNLNPEIEMGGFHGNPP